MTQIYDTAGHAIPVTVIQAGPCNVLQLRTNERDGYEAVQLGYLDKPRRLASRAQRGHVAKLDSKRQKSRGAAGIEAAPKADCEPKRFIRELRGSVEGYQIGQEVKVDLFADTAAVDITGTSKGKGTMGAMRRHNFHGQRASHGVKKVHRHVGSIGCNTFPHHVFKGRKMAGHMGDERCTMRNIRVVRVDSENNLLLVRGSVPGAIGGFVMIRRTNKLPVAAVAK
jgi:large subunit ribosomal protein L3